MKRLVTALAGVGLYWRWRPRGFDGRQQQRHHSVPAPDGTQLETYAGWIAIARPAVATSSWAPTGRHPPG